MEEKYSKSEECFEEWVSLGLVYGLEKEKANTRQRMSKKSSRSLNMKRIGRN